MICGAWETWPHAKLPDRWKYGNLTDDDLVFAEEKEDELLGRLQKKLGKSENQLRNIIELF